MTRKQAMKRILQLIPAVSFAAAAMMLCGCGVVQNSLPAAPVAETVSYAGLGGTVQGGRSPISGATMNLYQTGTTGYGAGATVIATTSTNSNGGFTFPAFSCTTGTQLYITSTGGNPGGGTNTNAILMSGVTSCANVSAYTHIGVNELTTVASVYALAPFMNGVLIGAPTTNQTGLAMAMADVLTLVNIVTGAEPGLNLPAGTTVPTTELYTLADILVACVNTNQCSTLFGYATPPGGSAPGDTLNAAIDIARNPGNNVSSLISLATSSSPFQPTLSTANDLTVAVTFTGGGSLSSASALAVDGAGQVWVTNRGTNSVTQLANTGAVLSGSSGYTAGSLNSPAAIAIDASGNAWIANSGNSTVSKVTASGGTATGTAYTGGGLSTPLSVAIDSQGMVWLSNINGAVSVFTPAGVGTAYTPAGSTDGVAIAINPH
jgi:hypothetical protein